jgi:hypothetical protein
MKNSFPLSEAQMIIFSRSIECSDEQGCLLEEGPDSMRLNIQESVSFPISMIDNDKVSTYQIATCAIALSMLFLIFTYFVYMEVPHYGR